MSKHSLASLGARHPVHNFVYADASARTGASGFLATDVGMVAKQTDDDTYWVLIATTPTWTEITSTGGGGGGLQMFRFGPNQALFPSADPAQGTSRNGHPLLAFDDSTDESVTFHGKMSEDYVSGSNLLVRIDWVASTATTGDVKWGVEVERIADGGLDIDSDSFDTQQFDTDTTDGTSGVTTRTTITLTNAQADAIAKGDAFRLRIERDTSVAGNMSGDAQILRVTGVQA